MTRDQYLDNALKQWKLFEQIPINKIRPFMELLLYYMDEPIKIELKRFSSVAKKRYIEFYYPLKQKKPYKWSASKHLWAIDDSID